MIVFQKNTRWTSGDGGIDILIVHINHSWNQLAYFDLAQEKPRRKPRKSESEALPQKPRRRRLESMPRTMPFDCMESLIKQNNCLPSRVLFKSDIHVPKRIKDQDRQMYVHRNMEIIERRWEVICPVVRDESLCFDLLYGKGARQKILELEKNFNVHEVDIKRWVVNYFARGGTKYALANDYSACGSNYNKPKNKDNPGKKRRRPPRNTVYRNATEEDRQQIIDFLRKAGKDLISKRSPRALYEKYDEKHQYFEVTLTNSENVTTTRRVDLPESECISEKSFAYELKKLLSDRDFLIAEKGEQGYLNDEAPTTGRARDDLSYPSQRYEVDATILDCYLLMPFRKRDRLVSGRPVLYLVKDVYSSMIVGMHLAFDGPNWRGVLQALHCAFTDKVKFCAGFGIKISDENWPCALVCTELMIDNGVEYKSELLEALLVSKFGLESINYARVYMGRDKGGVESEFNRLAANAVKFVPGYVERLPIRGSKHASTKAAYTYHELMRILIVKIITLNETTFNPKLHDQHMSEEFVSATPLAVWNYGLEHYADNGRGRSVDEVELLFDLLPKGTASTSANGIHYKDHYFNCNHAKKLGWLSDRKERPVKTLEVASFDSSNLRIWYRDPEGKIRQATLSDAHSGIYKGYTWCEATNRKLFYDAEATELNRVRRERRRQDSLSVADIDAQAKERCRENGQLIARKAATKIETTYNAMAAHNRMFRYLSEVFSKPEQLEVPNDIFDKAKNNNENAMFGEQLQ